MKYRHVSNLPMDVSAVGFGLWTIATKNWKSMGEANHVRILNDAFGLGINFFDTADSYSRGYGEKVLSDAFGSIRQEIVISTKIGYDFYSPNLIPNAPVDQNFDPSYIRFACEQSLNRLDTDYIDLLSLHYPGIIAVENDSTFEVLERLVEEGKILSYGAAIDDSEQSYEISEILLKDREVGFLQIPFSCVEKEPVLDLSFDGINSTLFARRIHGFGFLDGTLDPLEFKISEQDRDIIDLNISDKMLKAQTRAERFIDLSRETGFNTSQLSIAAVLDNSLVSSALPNIFGLEQLESYCQAVDEIEISDEIRDALLDLYQI